MALLLLGHEEATAVAADPMRGNLLSLLSGLFWAITLVGLRWLERDPGRGGEGLAHASVVAGNALAFVACLPAALPLGPTLPVDWALIAYLGVVQIGLAYLLLTRAMGRLSALEAGLLLMGEPVLAPLWAWAVHGGRPPRLALAGGAVILGAMVWRTVHGAARPSAAAEMSPPPA